MMPARTSLSLDKVEELLDTLLRARQRQEPTIMRAVYHVALAVVALEQGHGTLEDVRQPPTT